MEVLRSQNSEDIAFVRFLNRTERHVDVVWINYKGELEKKGTLAPGQHLDLNTYKTHPWIFVDRYSGENMLVGSKTVFFPQSDREFKERLREMQRNNDFFGSRSIRIVVHIDLPLFTLRRMCLHVIMNSLENIKKVKDLELPINLIADIEKSYVDRYNALLKYRTDFNVSIVGF